MDIMASKFVVKSIEFHQINTFFCCFELRSLVFVGEINSIPQKWVLHLPSFGFQLFI